VTLALIDEAMSWATIALGEKFAYTGETAARFEWPVRLGPRGAPRPDTADRAERRMTTEAVVLDAKGRPCVTARATMVVLDLGQAAAAIGTEVTGDDASYTR
jgi:hypothetical protein